MFRNQYRILLGIGVSLVILSLVACGGGAPAATPTPPAPPGETPAARAVTPTQPAAATPTQPPAPPAEDLQSRISDSLNRTMGVEEIFLPSYHLEISGAEPVWSAETSQVETKTYTLVADVSGDDIYLVYTRDSETIEGYIIDGGLAKEGGKEYEVVNGELQDSFTMGLTWALMPLGVGMPLIVAATGPTSQGGDNIDGRAAEKYGVDSANALPGVLEIVTAFINITSSRGTAWVDSETEALLKAILDYEQRFTDPEDPEKVLGTGSGHVEILVTRVGQVTVQLP